MSTWRDAAACRGCDPELWFPLKPSGGGSYRQRDVSQPAVTVCRGCPVQVDCLLEALDAPGLDGIWGGTSFDQRQRLRRRNREDAVKAVCEPRTATKPGGVAR